MILTNHDHQIRVGVLTGNGRRRGPRRGSGGCRGSGRAVRLPGAPPPAASCGAATARGAEASGRARSRERGAESGGGSGCARASGVGAAAAGGRALQARGRPGAPRLEGRQRGGGRPSRGQGLSSSGGAGGAGRAKTLGRAACGRRRERAGGREPGLAATGGGLARQPAPGGLGARLAPRLRMALPGGVGRPRAGEEGRRGAAAGSVGGPLATQALRRAVSRRCACRRLRGSPASVGLRLSRRAAESGTAAAARRGREQPPAARACERRWRGTEGRDVSEPFARRARSSDGEPGPTAAVRARVAVCSCSEEGAAIPAEGAGSCSGSCAPAACRTGPPGARPRDGEQRALSAARC